VGVVTFDSDVLIGFLNRDDAHHREAVDIVRAAAAPGVRRLLCAVNYAEILIGPTRVGRQAVVDDMLAHLSFEIVDVDKALANRAAAVRVQTGLKLPDAFALATALQADRGAANDVELVSFDKAVVKAYNDVRGRPAS
jgi:predicted nucleic acid-binding protein